MIIFSLIRVLSQLYLSFQKFSFLVYTYVLTQFQAQNAFISVVLFAFGSVQSKNLSTHVSSF